MPLKKSSGLGNLASLLPDNWFSNRDDSSFWLRIYTALLIPHDKFEEIVVDFLPDPDKHEFLWLIGDKKVLFGFGTAKGMKLPVITFDMFAQESGQTTVKVKCDQKKLENTNNVFLITPFRIDGTQGNELVARKTLDTAASLICVHTGLSFMWHVVYEGEVSAKGGSFSSFGPPMRMPQPAEGPFLDPQNGEDISEINERINKLREQKYGRVLLALQLMNDAMRKNDALLEYWTALEVICNGKVNRIKTRLKQIYGLKSQQEAGAATGLNRLAEWRHEYFHRGIRPSLSADVERYIQLMFLDLLRFEIDLPPRGHLASIQAAEGCDLSPIGLADKRTKEQREAAETHSAR